MAEHTKLPWIVKPAERYGDGFWIGTDAENAAHVPGYQDHPQIVANASLIVRAVNSHEALVKALQQAALELGEAANLLRDAYPTTASIFDVAATKAISLLGADRGGVS